LEEQWWVVGFQELGFSIISIYPETPIYHSVIPVVHPPPCHSSTPSLQSTTPSLHLICGVTFLNHQMINPVPLLPILGPEYWSDGVVECWTIEML